MGWPERVSAIATAFLVGVIAYQAYLQNLELDKMTEEVGILRNQTKNLIDQTESLKEQVSISRQQFESTIAPFVGFKDISLVQAKCPNAPALGVDEISKFGRKDATYQNLTQYTFRWKCPVLTLKYDITFRNYGSIPAESIEAGYAISDHRMLNNTSIESIDLISSPNILILMPDQETTVQLELQARIQNFGLLEGKEDRKGTFQVAPDRLIAYLQYEFLKDQKKAIGIIYDQGNSMNLRIINTWNRAIRE